jgi:hypothetical protein
MQTSERRPTVTRMGTVMRWSVAALMLGSAGIHFGMMGEHAGISWTHGTFFAITAWVQLAIAALVVLRPTRRVLLGSAAVNLGILGVWLVDRTIGIAIGGDGTPAKFTSIDITCAIFEGLAVVLLLALLAKGVERRPLSAGVGFAGVAFVGLLVAALTGYVFSPAAASDGNGGTASDGHDHVHAGATAADGHDHTHAAVAGGGGLVDAGAAGIVVTGALTGKSPCELSGPPASTGQVGQDAEGHNHRGPLLQAPLTREETLALAAEQEQARQVAVRYPTVAAAEAAGYRKSTVYVPCIGAHYTNTRYAVKFDVNNPSELLYDGTTPDAKIVGLSDLVFHLNGPPEGFTGPNDHWHQHNFNGGLCLNGSGVVIGAESMSKEQCEASGGRKAALDDIWMVHDWVVPGFECTWGPFAGECPELGGRTGGTAWDPPAKGSAGAIQSESAAAK